MTRDSTTIDPSAVLFFDGECGFCHRGMRFFMKRDTHRALRYAPLQSSRGKIALKKANLPSNSLSTLVFLKGTDIKLKSDAVLAALQELSLFWKCLAYGLKCFPRKLLNKGYDYIARNRQNLPYFKNACQIPTPEERKWFIDF